MFLRTIIPVWAVLFCACVGATTAFAQEEPSEDELESARQRLRQALDSGALPPAAFESDPVPDWAVPNHVPKVLPEATAQPAERANTEVVDPNILSSQQSVEKESPPPEPASAQKPQEPASTQKQKPKKPAVARKKENPKLKTGRAAAGDAKPKAEKPKPEKPQSPPAPTLVLPQGLRP